MFKTNSKSTLLNGFFAFVLSAFMIVAGCKKNAPMQPEPVVQSPQLKLSATSLAFSDNQLEQQIIISNQGGGSFSWTLSGQPDWLTFSKSQGTVSSSPDTITAQADPALGNGDYSATLSIRWGGDPQSIAATYQVRNKPALSVNTGAVSLSNDGNDTVFVIANGGAGTLNWNVAQKPAWLEFSKESGAVTSVPDSVSIRPIAGLSVGDYTGQIDISSNGGQHTLEVALKVEQKVEVFPGTGAAGLNLNDTYFKLLFIHGSANRAQIALVCSGSKCIWVHFKYYDAKGLMFVLVSSSNALKASDPVAIIKVSAPYLGVTEKLVGIGSSLDEVKNAYGEPEKINTTSKEYEYKSLGVDFGYDNAMASVEDMTIYPASSGTRKVARSASMMDKLMKLLDNSK